jgi:HAD superfamily hydrolase (TIGR01509 family)
MGLRKPDPAIYAAVDRELGIASPAEVLFVDDNAANSASAAKHGWGTILFQ